VEVWCCDLLVTRRGFFIRGLPGSSVNSVSVFTSEFTRLIHHLTHPSILYFPISTLSNMTGDSGEKKERKMEYRHIYKRYGMRPTLDSLANALRNAPMTRHNITLSLSLLGNYNPFLPGIYLYIQLFSDAILYFPRSDSDGLRWELRPAPTGRSRPRDWRRTNSLLHRKHQRYRQSLSAWRDDFCGRTARRYAYSSNSR
jgi:hypothetical protein